MATQEEYAQLKAYSRIDGALVGLMWAVSFGCMVAGFKNPSWSFAAIVIGFASPIYGISRMIKFRRKVLDNKMSYRRALGYAIMMLLCATLILAGVQLVYFQFFDHGYFIENYATILKSPEMMEAAVNYGLSEQDIDSTIAVISEMRPVEVVIQFLSSNVLLSVMLSIPMALFAKKS
jgi:multisubunit Na+/H+ antiporter MnhB subunit